MTEMPTDTQNATKIGVFWRRKVTSGAVIGICILCLAGCDSLYFYRQAAGGQLSLLLGGESVAKLLDSEHLTPERRRQLLHAQSILRWGEQTMSLPSKGNYGRFVELERKHVLWNVFISPKFAFHSDSFCYPLVGCAPYRGFFEESVARSFADRYRLQGFDTYVGAVDAYSTLGWFRDPLLSSFIDYPPPALARLLLHELAHSKIWISGDVAFNESFASFVGDKGASQWSAANAIAYPPEFEDRRQAWRALVDFALSIRHTLGDLYRQPDLSEAQRLAEKTKLLNGARACYQVHRDQLGGGRFDGLMGDGLNNALLLSLSTYENWQPVFKQLFQEANEDWQVFFLAVENLAQGPDQQRAAQLVALRRKALGEQQEAAEADDHNPQTVQCEALSDHTLN